MKAIIALVTIGLITTSCALDPYHLGDPMKIAGAIPASKVPEITKSLKCELITFETENRVREDIKSFYFKAKNDPGYINQVKSAGSVPLDPLGITYVALDIKNVNTGNFSLGYDWNKPTTYVKPSNATLSEILASRESRTLHLGPSYIDTGTYEFTSTLGIPQDDLLGYASKDIDRVDYDGIFKDAQNSPVSFDGKYKSSCYSNLFAISRTSALRHDTIELKQRAQEDIQRLVNNDESIKSHVDFDRVYIGETGQTLASWLQVQATQAAYNTLTPALEGDSKSEAMQLGQLSYQFTLDAKPGLDMSMKLIAGYADPLFPDASVAQEHSANFQLYLNTASALGIGQAKSGNARAKPGPVPPQKVEVTNWPGGLGAPPAKHGKPEKQKPNNTFSAPLPKPFLRPQTINPLVPQEIVPKYPYIIPSPSE